MLVAVSYWVYSLVRNFVPEQERTAQAHARAVLSLQESLGIAVERRINQAADSVEWLIVGMNYYYATLHFGVTIGVLVWLYLRRPHRYRPLRSALFATTGLALIGYYFYPLAPPRLMPESYGYIDTVVKHGTWGSMASGDMANLSNQYAAMPSMHIGWSLWCALAVALVVRRTWLRVAALCYPLATLVVIVATGNHFLLDAVGGTVCVGLGFGVARLLGRLPIGAGRGTGTEARGQAPVPATQRGPEPEQGPEPLTARIPRQSGAPGEAGARPGRSEEPPATVGADSGPRPRWSERA
ncbi:phosphatase PAP2 family protein [Allostreptomyces psammosilenae]|uniref:Inositolphosphotransferase Aur1/Ipt1 domain-containing protein n=1 Tax=Allostreptomyces psammosilenae TaxID=1892865 RepID=A0A852ZXP3_9ACTN|nr:hypothetical protein [Allostreptomyces psammosilenae]